MSTAMASPSTANGKVEAEPAATLPTVIYNPAPLMVQIESLLAGKKWIPQDKFPKKRSAKKAFEAEEEEEKEVEENEAEENLKEDTMEEKYTPEQADGLEKPSTAAEIFFYDVLDDPDEQKADREVENPNWRWPAYNEVEDQYGGRRFMRMGRPGDKEKGSPFQIIYKKLDAVLWPDETTIKFKSMQLINILKSFLPENKGLQYRENLDINGREIYLVLQKLKNHQFSEVDGDTTMLEASEKELELSPKDLPVTCNGRTHVETGTENDNTQISTEKVVTDTAPDHEMKILEAENLRKGKLHFGHLIRFLEEEYKEVIPRNARMKAEKSVSYDMLWAFLGPGTKVIYKCFYTGELLCGIVAENAYRQTQCSSLFWLDIWVWDYNTEVYRRCKTSRTISAFTGEDSFDSLEVWPVEMDERQEEDLDAEFIAKGKRFQNLAMEGNNCFMHYRGPSFEIKDGAIRKESADGRVMIDIRSFHKMNPSYSMFNAQPPVSYGDGNDGLDFGHNAHSAGRAKRLRRLSRENCGQSVDTGAEESRLGSKPTKLDISEESLLFAPAVVYGFSFSLKKWGVFAVTGFSDIVFNTNAFDALVMEPELKGLVYSLVDQYIGSKADTGVTSIASGVDPIANKGDGCIFLCYGPPGTGKTLTAESIAENMRRPLWSLSVAELGTTPAELEKMLVQILEIGAMWQAVLLLDEADIYLEKRGVSGDVTRNAMTGVFLRLLEYYRGVLFLTTNRVVVFDDAFRSRISLFLHYPKLKAEQREQIWRASLARVQSEDVMSDAFLADIARNEINGREIRNAIHTARNLALSRGETLQESHLRFVMRIVANTMDILSSATQTEIGIAG